MNAVASSSLSTISRCCQRSIPNTPVRVSCRAVKVRRLHASRIWLDDYSNLNSKANEKAKEKEEEEVGDSELWAMPPPSSALKDDVNEAGPSRIPLETHATMFNPSASASISGSSSSSSMSDTNDKEGLHSPIRSQVSVSRSTSTSPSNTISSSSSASSSSSMSPSPSSPPLPKWIPPHWHAHFQPNATWRTNLQDRLEKAEIQRKRIMIQVSENRKRMLGLAGENLSILGMKLNEVTGYKEVERLKEEVGEKENRLHLLRATTKTAKSSYDNAIQTRSETQSSVNSLLERKHTWSDSDVLRFTQLVRTDHTSTQAVTQCSEKLKEMELKTDKAFNDLMQAILARYHEEQVWSDKIRSMSTWVGLAGLLVNLVVFLGAVVFVEPWKRRRLVAGIEERMGEMMSRVEGEIGRLAAASEAKQSTPVLEGSGTLQADSTTKVGTSLEAASTAAMLALNEEEAISVLPSAPALSPTPSHIDQALEYASPLLDRIAPASRDRDILFSAGCGVVLGMTTMAISTLFR